MTERIIASQQLNAEGVMSMDTTIERPVARLKSEAIFGKLARRVASFELTGEPKPRLNNTLRGLGTLPLRVKPV